MVLLYWSIFLLDTGNISLLICKQSNFFKSFTGHCEFYVIDLWCFPLISVWLSRGTLTCMPFCPSRGSLSSCPWVGPEQTALQPVKLRDDRWPPENSLRSPMLYQTSSLRLLSSGNCLAPCFLVPFFPGLWRFTLSLCRLVRSWRFKEKPLRISRAPCLCGLLPSFLSENGDGFGLPKWQSLSPQVSKRQATCVFSHPVPQPGHWGNCRARFIVFLFSGLQSVF